MKTATEKKLKRINYHGGDDDASHDYGDGDIDDDEYGPTSIIPPVIFPPGGNMT